MVCLWVLPTTQGFDAQEEPFPRIPSGELWFALPGLKAGVPSREDQVLKF